MVYRKSIGDRTEQCKIKIEQTNLFKSANTRILQNSNAWALVYYIKRKYHGKANLCYMNRASFIVNLKTDDIYNWKHWKLCWKNTWHIKVWD